MKTIETNIFPIRDFGGLTATYDIFSIDGLSAEQDEYHENCHRLQRRATKLCNAGAIVLKRSSGTVLAVPEGLAVTLPTSLVLARAKVAFRPTAEKIRVDFKNLTPETERLAIRYLQTAVRDSVRLNGQLWQPDSRNLFFEKYPIEKNDVLGMYRGFGVTIATLPEGGFGLAVDVQFKFITLRPLKSRLSEQEFNTRHRMHTFVYHFGDTWYEVELVGWTSAEVAGYRCGESNAQRSLLSWLHENCPRPLSSEIAQLDKGGTVLEYANSENQTRGVPAQLCYRMFDSGAPEIQEVHRYATRLPEDRRLDIATMVRTHLSKLHVGKQTVTVETNPWKSLHQRFDAPDLRFGGNRILSVRNTPGSTSSTVGEYGRMRLRLLEDQQAGPLVRDGLCQQYLLLPKTVENTWGSLFEKDFIAAVNRLYAHEQGYAPRVIFFDDTAARTFVDQADAIAQSMADCGDGYAVVMLPDAKVRTPQREDALAACTTERLAANGVISAFVHATSAQSFYRYHSQNRMWEVPNDHRLVGRYRSYLRLGALNKVMLTTRQWPFSLAGKLHADVTVGIDVKGHTAGFTAVCPTSTKVWCETTETKRKEKLSRSKCREMIVRGITRLTQAASGLLPTTIVVQRDGRMFEPEIDAAKDALEELKRDGVVAATATLTCVEIPKSGGAAFRLFDDYTDRGTLRFRNPEYGTYCNLGENEGFVCNTGLAFRVPGTVRPLHVKRVYGKMPIKQCLEDVFHLACLTWSQPEGCSRHPVTVRLNDRQLVDVATPFDDEDDEAPVMAAREINGGSL
jgi:hypothetical protein